MRIISGKFGGRKISPPANMPYTRPTTDIAKEGLFNILQNNIEFEGAKTLDLFGGTGSISYELASRGAAEQVIVEKDPAMHAFISKTVELLGLTDTVRVVRMDVFKYMDSCTDQYDFIFAGPPYALTTIDELPKKVVEKQLLKPGGMFVLEHTPRNNYQGYEWFVQERNYGTTVFSFFINR
ncbi:RsmD family RNA methyltransferase [Flavihumibacter cheonanensis]|jgi:16S rRNA (guanine966-N2)-methyltransferase|uniref:RsmD family RNA methyltransferase n=1 Tax=Flavihumibacter cheonanensis TaxID=1442385 RepID=UPI001EF75F2A|nr:RsmD family RNA methyltransferase [Flavihumibacter cheonanensis]MCG7751303.1 RsmD family RNA methyltransferase [Flavihumibacter cheonanensis]